MKEKESEDWKRLGKERERMTQWKLLKTCWALQLRVGCLCSRGTLKSSVKVKVIRSDWNAWRDQWIWWNRNITRNSWEKKMFNTKEWFYNVFTDSRTSLHWLSAVVSVEVQVNSLSLLLDEVHHPRTPNSLKIFFLDPLQLEYYMYRYKFLDIYLAQCFLNFLDLCLDVCP